MDYERCPYYSAVEILEKFPLPKCDRCPYRTLDDGLLTCELRITTSTLYHKSRDKQNLEIEGGNKVHGV